MRRARCHIAGDAGRALGFSRGGSPRERAVIGRAGTPFPVRTIGPATGGGRSRPRAGRAVAQVAREGRGRLSDPLDQACGNSSSWETPRTRSSFASSHRYGVLTGAAPRTQRAAGITRGWDLVAGTEPLAAWRAIAQGFRRRARRGHGGRHPRFPRIRRTPLPRRRPGDARAARVAIFKWLANREGRVAMPTLDDDVFTPLQ